MESHEERAISNFPLLNFTCDVHQRSHFVADQLRLPSRVLAFLGHLRASKTPCQLPPIILHGKTNIGR